MNRQALFAILLATTAVAPSTSWAAGFALNEQSAHALGMANAVTAVANRPDAILFNPAGLVWQRGFGLQANLALVAPRFGYDTTVPSSGEPLRAESKDEVFPLPSLFASYRATDRVAVGLGVYVPFGLAVRWDDQFSNGVVWWARSMIQDIEVQSVFITPTVSVQLHDRVALGLGLAIVQASVTLQRAITASNDPADDVNVRLSGDDLDFGGNVGLLVKAIPDRLNVGFSFRSGVDLTFAGDAVFTKGGSGDNVPAALRARLVDGRVEAPLRLPHVLSFGVAAFPIPSLTVSANVDLITWSSYKKLTINFIDNPELSSSDAKNWNNTVAVRLGAEYYLLADNLPVRLGFIFDQSPVPDDTVGPELPDADRYLIAAGVGYRWGGLEADLAYQFLLTPEQATSSTAPVVGTRDAQAHIFAFGLSYDMDM